MKIAFLKAYAFSYGFSPIVDGFFRIWKS